MRRDLSRLTDEELVARAAARDDAAFEEIVHRWDRKIFALCFGMLGCEHEARDATQETFVAAYKGIDKFRGDAKLSSWLHRIAVNRCISFKRRESSRNEELIGDDDDRVERTFVADASSSPAAEAETKERVSFVRNAVTALPADLRQIVVMKEFQEMTFAEISHTLEIPLSTVKSRLYAAFKQLRGKLKRSAAGVDLN